MEPLERQENIPLGKVLPSASLCSQVPVGDGFSGGVGGSCAVTASGLLRNENFAFFFQTWIFLTEVVLEVESVNFSVRDLWLCHHNGAE